MAGMSVLVAWKTLPVFADDDSPADIQMLGTCVDTNYIPWQCNAIQLLSPIKITGKKPINIILTFFHYYGSLILKFGLGFCMGGHFILRLT